jgi:hypothetical protein
MYEEKPVFKNKTHDLRSFILFLSRKLKKKREGMRNYIPELVYLTIRIGLSNINIRSTEVSR